MSHKLSWTHYRRLIRIEDKHTRNWYEKEAIEQSWSVRALDRQISVLYYERLLSSRDGSAVKHEAEQKTRQLSQHKQDSVICFQISTVFTNRRRIDT